MKISPVMKEITLNVIAFMWLLFVLTNANSSLGTAYLMFLVGGTVLLFINLLIFNRGARITFQNAPGGTIRAFFSGAVGWVVLLVTSFVVLKIVDPVKATVGQIVSSMGAANPAFSNSQIINWVTVSFAIGYAETQLWARLLEFLADRFNIKIDRNNKFALGFIVLIILLSIGFLIFHLTSKGVGATSALIIVFIMMMISLFMVAYYGETRQAVWMHIIANGAAGLILMLNGGVLA